AVLGARQILSQPVHAVFIGRIHSDLTEIVRALIGGIHESPRLATIGGTEQTAAVRFGLLQVHHDCAARSLRLLLVRLGIMIAVILGLLPTRLRGPATPLPRRLLLIRIWLLPIRRGITATAATTFSIGFTKTGLGLRGLDHGVQHIRIAERDIEHDAA